MPYVLTRKNGKKARSPFVFTEDEIENIGRRSPGDCYEFLSPITMRTKKVGGACRRPKKRRR